MLFLILWIFLLFFFWEFSSQGRVGTEFRTKTFFSLLGLSHPTLDRNNAGMMFLNFLNFFALSFRNFLARVWYEWHSGLKLFSLFLGQSHPGLDRNNARIVFFFIFRIVLLFFLEFSGPGWVGLEFWIKIFLSLSRPIFSRFG